ncbi:MAG: hypothetical protein COS68_04450 [Elusimicrobia bacterium CG06_land_8_20_14_3_00_38_11]|nr:MAG: hypothetical protein COS68_04450 [Elusimicrobia bacterium CG06_land_8_20_14_3_00_38_11]
MKLSEVEKKEMLEDGKNKKRTMNFRKGRYIHKKMSFEEYIDWLQEMQKIHPVNPPREFVVYKNVKI